MVAMTIMRTGTRKRRAPEETPLRLARLAKGLSQAELAAQAGLSLGWVSLVERTPQFITASTATRLAAVLGIPAEKLQP